MGTGEGEAPLVPKIDLRTMTSDLDSIKEGGGGPPRPYVPPPPTFGKTEEQAEPASSFEPPKIEETAAVQFPAGVPLGGKPKSRGVFMVILVVILIVGLGAVGYFFAYPYFFKQPEREAAAPPSAETPTPTILTIPIVPEGEFLPTEGVATETEASPIETPPPPLLSADHISLFKKAAAASSEISPAALNLTSLKQAFGS